MTLIVGLGGRDLLVDVGFGANGQPTLRNLSLTQTTSASTSSSEITRDEVELVLRDEFGLEITPGASLRALDGPIGG